MLHIDDNCDTVSCQPLHPIVCSRKNEIENINHLDENYIEVSDIDMGAE